MWNHTHGREESDFSHHDKDNVPLGEESNNTNDKADIMTNLWLNASLVSGSNNINTKQPLDSLNDDSIASSEGAIIYSTQNNNNTNSTGK